MKRLITLFFIFFIPFSSFACLNIFHHNAKGKETGQEHNRLVYPFNPAFSKAHSDKFLSDYNLANVSSYEKETQSDIAVYFLRLGRFEEALSILKRLVEEYPDQYEFNANLGTTYELLGKNELALKYIKRGLEIKPWAHERSEWIHVTLLESKLAIEKEPDWLKTNTFLGLEQLLREASIRGNEEDFVYALRRQLDYQLRTRISFVPRPDLSTCLMFKELAENISAQYSTSLAHGYAMMAEYYAPTEALQIETAALVEQNRKLTEQYYRGKSRIRLKPFSYYLDTTRFVKGVNGVKWFKSSLTDADYQLIEDTRKLQVIEIKLLETTEETFEFPKIKLNFSPKDRGD